MAIIRCTQKLLSTLKKKPEQCPEPQTDLEGWHANLILIERRKCILFTHDKTLYSVFVPGLTKPDFLRINDCFGQHLFKSLLRDNFPQEQIELFLHDIQNICFDKTNNRSVLGSMTDLALNIKTAISVRGGLEYTDMNQLNYNLNRIPMNAIDLNYSIEELTALLNKLGS